MITPGAEKSESEGGPSSNEIASGVPPSGKIGKISDYTGGKLKTTAHSRLKNKRISLPPDPQKKITHDWTKLTTIDNPRGERMEKQGKRLLTRCSMRR